MAKLTWNQRRALEKLYSCRDEISGILTAQIADLPRRPAEPYLCGASARTAVMALVRKGLAKCIPVSPLRYRITDAGRAALRERE